MEEIWKFVPGYPRYEASNLGQIRSWATFDNTRKTLRKEPHLLKLTDDGNYYRVGLCNEDGVILHTVGRIILTTFIGPCPNGMECCHNDGNPYNNKLNNLRWDTRKGNFKDRTKHGNTVMGENQHNAKLTEDDIRQIRKRANQGEMYIIIANDYSVTGENISYIARRMSWKHIL